MSKVVVFGSFVVDLMARSPHLPSRSETVKGSYFQMGAGGKGFNQGVACHKVGADMTMVTKLGNDSFKDVCLNSMEELDMSKDYILISEEKPTGIALIMVDENTGDNQITVVPSACNDIKIEEVNSLENLIKEAEYILLQYEVNQDANERIKELALKNNTKVIVNTAPYVEVDDDFYKNLYMVTPNEVEAEAVTGIKVDNLENLKKAASIFREKGVENVLITLGTNGVFVSDGNKEEIIDSFKVKTVDTTGAGDAFNGGFLAALSEGKDIWQAAVFANAVAALSVQKLGTTPAMPSREEVDKFLEERTN
ncbi:ribokinase [Anaerococcus degeneri]|uniref:Ribokinase n=1 Tax=Anaerococcus degeneri TaxID=361500 RepID=A0ABS7YX84_9FIRM|nr:ribokinase [Anaerococcus degeneri]MBP2016337.1 ribokinase [Anaerococcus degeneri]MCA2096353.1 ribokinase [Anaerococcus degeneri]